MIRYWSLNAENAGGRKKLIAATTERLIREDVALPEASSLIASAEQLFGIERNSSNLHLLLASGALFEHALHLKATVSENGRVTFENQAPTSDPVTHIGGSKSKFLVPLWEMPLP